MKVRTVLETINWLALTVPFIAAGATYTSLQEKRWPKALAGIVALFILAVVFVGYTFMYRSLGFPLWMRWLAPVAAYAEPLPGKPEVQINTKLDADWIIVGMNYEWMVLVAKAHLQIGARPEIYIRWEHVDPQDTDGGKKYLSAVNWVELDCSARRMNTMMINSFTANNLADAEVYSGQGDPRQPNWNAPEAGSIGSEAIRKGCELFGK